MVDLIAPPILNGKRSPLQDEFRRARLRGFLDGEAYEGNWWAVIRLQDGTLVEETGQGPPYVPPGDYRSWARKVCNALNDEVHYNGMWTVVIFTNATRWAFVWKDWDGDIEIFVDEDSPLEQISRCRIERMLEHADQAILEWMIAVFSNVEVKPQQQVKLAQGERPTTQMVPDELIGH